MGDDTNSDHSISTAKQLATDRLLAFVDKRTFRDLIRDVEQIDGKREVRVAHSPVNGPTEDGNGTWYLPDDEPVY
jgi:hypothetical protein